MAVFEVNVIQPKRPAKSSRRRFECPAMFEVTMIRYELINGRWATMACASRVTWRRHIDWPLDYPAVM